MRGKPETGNLEAFTRSLYLTGVLGAGVTLLTAWLVGFRFGLGVLVSAGWSLLNLILLRQMALRLPRAIYARTGRWAVLLLLVVKFPILYVLGYALLASRWLPLASLLIGLSLWIVGFLGTGILFVVTAASFLAGWLFVPPAFADVSEAGGGIEMPELPNLITFSGRFLHGQPIGHFLHHWETAFFTLLIICFLGGLAWLSTRRLSMVPSKRQSAVEVLVEGFDGFVCGILGPSGRRFTPFLGTLFLYILVSNLSGLIPLFKSPTTGFRSIPGFPLPMIPLTTLPLALVVFGYVQWTAIRHRGLVGYLDHLAGEPRNIFTILVAPIMFVLHVLGEVLTKPLSLSFRLFGNISSEDSVVAVLVGMGFAFLWVEFPILWLALILSTVQAVVFTLLSTIYIAMVLPHGEEEHLNRERGANHES